MQLVQIINQSEQQTYCMQSKAAISVEQIPRFEFNLNDQQLQSYLKELSFNQTAQKKEIEKLRKQIQKRPADFSVAEASSLASTEIDIDTALLKEIKSKDNKPIEESNPIRKAAKQFSKKLGAVSTSINCLHQLFKGLDKRLKIVEIQHPTETQNKTKYLQGRIEQIQQLLSLDISNLTQQVQESVSQNIENNKQIERKTVWQIGECKKALESRITEQYVKDSMSQFQQKIVNRMKEQQLKLNFDPDKIIRMDTKVSKLQHQFNMNVIEVEQQFKVVNDRMVNNLINRTEYSEDKIKTEKRLTLMNNNVSEVHKKILIIEEEKNRTNASIKEFNQILTKVTSDVKKINEALENMKIGGEFIEMMEKIDVHKICLMDNSIEALKVENNRISRDLEGHRKELEKIRMKNSYLETLQPEHFPHMKVKREEIEQIVVDCLANNAYLKRMQTIELKFADIDNCLIQISNLDRKVNKLSKQNDLHNIIYQLRGLEQYMKKEILLMQNKLSHFQAQAGQRKNGLSRPNSATRISLSNSNSSINVKKLHPISCISHYQTVEFAGTDQFGDIGKGNRTSRASSTKWRKD